MTTSTDSQQHLADVLNEQIRCAESMLKTLEHESDALLAGDADKLNDASAGKARLADALDQLEIERRGLTESLGFHTSAAADGSETSQSWNRLIELLEQCRERNTRNGGLVQARRTQVETALQALSSTPQGSGYDSAGKRNRTAASHRLGSA